MAKPLILLLGVVLLAQYCVARSLGAVHDDIEVTDRDSLEYFGTLQFKNVAKNTVNNGKKWLQCAHEEIETIARKNEKTRELDDRIVEYLSKERQLRRIHDEEKKAKIMSELFKNFLDLSSEYDLSDENNPDSELKSIAELLIRNGMDVFDELFMADFMQCAEKIVCATELYINSLSANQKREETHLIRWLNDFKTEDDLWRKIDIFSAFFQLLSD